MRFTADMAAMQKFLRRHPTGRTRLSIWSSSARARRWVMSVARRFDRFCSGSTASACLSNDSNSARFCAGTATPVASATYGPGDWPFCSATARSKCCACPRGVAAKRLGQAVERDHQLVKRAVVPRLVERERALRQRAHDGEVDGEIRPVESERNRRAPGRGRPVQHRHVLPLGAGQRRNRIGQQLFADAAAADLHGPQAVATPAQVELERALAQRLAPPRGASSPSTSASVSTNA